jgi:hypothetical protein
VPLTLVRLTCHALEGGPATPSNIFYVLMQDHAVTSGRRDRSSPSLSALCGHPRHCRTTPDAVATSRRCWDVRGQDFATTATVPRTGSPSTASSNWPTTAASQPTTAPQPSKPLLYEHRTHHDVPNGAGFARTAVSFAALFAIPLHIEIVKRACKLHPPWSIKGGAASQPQGTRDDGQQSLTRSPPSPRYRH